MHKKFLFAAAILGAFSVMLGAFATHQLKQLLAPDVLQIFETAVKYQMYHVFALLFAGLLYKEFPVKMLLWSGNLFITGIVLFSGSLYALCIIKHLNFDALWIGAITPLGGLCFIMGWLLMALGVVNHNQNSMA
jgi:uncharacterized membrane protein YgdD (TMEM256/DUF423 family)